MKYLFYISLKKRGQRYIKFLNKQWRGDISYFLKKKDVCGHFGEPVSTIAI